LHLQFSTDRNRESEWLIGAQIDVLISVSAIDCYLPFVGKGNPSSVHVICGVGLPVAEHFSDTAGPGCKVCSMKLYVSIGGASV
jgi:hypothetical protein